MRPRLLLTSCLYAVAGARRPPPTDAITQKHVGDNQLNAYAIGAGFEGSASDWTEYVVWTVGVAALICLLYTSPSPRDQRGSRMPSSA